jgi:hypothetical protein
VDKPYNPVGVGVVNQYREFCLVVNQGKKEKENHYSPVSNQTSINNSPFFAFLIAFWKYRVKIGTLSMQ